MAADEVQLKKGGEVSKDHPHYKYLKDLDKFMADHFPKGKKVETDPAIKAEKAMKAKKGSIEPMKFSKGSGRKGVEGALDIEKRLNKEQQDAYKAFLKKGMPDSIKKIRISRFRSKKSMAKNGFKKGSIS